MSLLERIVGIASSIHTYIAVCIIAMVYPYVGLKILLFISVFYFLIRSIASIVMPYVIVYKYQSIIDDVECGKLELSDKEKDNIKRKDEKVFVIIIKLLIGATAALIVRKTGDTLDLRILSCLIFYSTVMIFLVDLVRGYYISVIIGENNDR